MALSRVKTWSAGEVLTASDLNTEFNNILSNAFSLISPLTGNLDLDGNEFVLDADADTSISADTDDRVDFKLGGTDIIRFNTVASAVNGIDFYGSATGNQPYIRPQGTDSNFGLDIRDSNGNEIIITDGVASAVNEITITNAATGNNPSITISGTDATGLDLLSGALNEAKGSDIASATTTDIGAATGNFVDITGNTTITGFGTVKAGTRRTARFTGAPLLTYNATSLITPMAADYQVVAGDVLELQSLGSGNWIISDIMDRHGTWTPTLQDSSLSDAEGQTYSVQEGRYTKIGNRVLFEFSIILTSIGTLTGGDTALIAGLPFTSANTTNNYGQACASYGVGLSILQAASVTGTIQPNTAYITLESWDVTAGVSAMTVGEVSGNGRINMFGQYVV